LACHVITSSHLGRLIWVICLGEWRVRTCLALFLGDNWSLGWVWVRIILPMLLRRYLVELQLWNLLSLHGKQHVVVLFRRDDSFLTILLVWESNIV